MSKPRTLSISVRTIATTTIVDLEGAIHLGNSAALRTTLFDTLPATSRLALNMTGVWYVDSSGIATLIEALKKSQDLKRELVLFGVGATVRDVLKLTNLLGVFKIVENEERALESGGR